MSKQHQERIALLSKPQGSRPEALEDLIWVLAANIEESIMQSSNAIGGIDYTVMDLYKLALPFALHTYKESGLCYFTDSWPPSDGDGELF